MMFTGLVASTRVYGAWLISGVVICTVHGCTGNRTPVRCNDISSEQYVEYTNILMAIDLSLKGSEYEEWFPITKETHNELKRMRDKYSISDVVGMQYLVRWNQEASNADSFCVVQINVRSIVDKSVQASRRPKSICIKMMLDRYGDQWAFDQYIASGNTRNAD